MKTIISASLVSIALSLAACGGSSSGGGGGGNPPPQQPSNLGVAATDRFEMANGCYALRSGDGRYISRLEDGRFSSEALRREDASPLFMKPAALGVYLIYGDDQTLMSAAAGIVGSSAALNDTLEWRIEAATLGGFQLISDFAGQALAVNPESRRLELVDLDLAGSFDLLTTDDCSSFPEIRSNSVRTTYKGKGVDQPVIGFADVHAHISATDFLGGAHYGYPFHRYGVTEALGNCEGRHGPQGGLDLVGNLLGPSGNPLGTHDTQGWPTFIDWPKRDALTHEAMYYKWVERAWLAGLRVLVNDLVENEVLCRLQSAAALAVVNGMEPADIIGSVADIPTPAACNEMESAVSQIQFMHDMEDYIDAQEGGPGKGWFRIVESPAQARQVINEGKLAVVLGIEISHLFNCKITKLGSLTEFSDCDETEIATQMDRLLELGVRQMFPVHEFDNSFGGNGIFDGFVLNVGNFVDTGQFWRTYNCPDQEYFFQAGAIMTSADPSGGGNPLSDVLTEVIQGTLPIYPTDTFQCNARGLTPLGEFTFTRLMDKKVIIELDHLELSIKDDLLDMAAAREPDYPLVSTHGGHGGISIAQTRRILAGGGLLYPAKGNGRQFVDDLNRLRPLKSANHDFAMGYGADTNGLATQSGPRGSGAPLVNYPFTLFTGAGWGPQFDGIEPLRFEQSSVPEGNRNFDINVEGLTHYGMIADWVEAVRLEGGEQAITDLYNSAEVYLQVWERTLNR